MMYLKISWKKSQKPISRNVRKVLRVIWKRAKFEIHEIHKV